MDYGHNIGVVYDIATLAQVRAGMDWYPSANNLANEIANGDTWLGAGLIAAFSPLTPWWRNVELATDSARTGIARTDTLSNSTKAAQRMLDGEHPLDVLKGDKTRAFCANVAMPDNDENVTIDTHAFSIAHATQIPPKATYIGKRIYRTIADAYREVAESKGLLAIEIQAITWVTWRELFPNKATNREVW